MPEATVAPLSLRELLSAVIRILVIKLGINGALFTFGLIKGVNGGRWVGTWGILAGLLVAVLLAAACLSLWHLSPSLARRIAGGGDSSIATGNITAVDLYSFAFLLLGLYFVADNLGPCLSWLYYSLTMARSDTSLSNEQESSFYMLFGYLTKLLAGAAFVFKGRSLAGKLIRTQNSG
jgi:hypothetical protein